MSYTNKFYIPIEVILLFFCHKCTIYFTLSSFANKFVVDNIIIDRNMNMNKLS